MLALDFRDLSQHSDVLRLRDGQSVTVRFVEGSEDYDEDEDQGATFS